MKIGYIAGVNEYESRKFLATLRQGLAEQGLSEDDLVVCRRNLEQRRQLMRSGGANNIDAVMVQLFQEVIWLKHQGVEVVITGASVAEYIDSHTLEEEGLQCEDRLWQIAKAITEHAKGTGLPMYLIGPLVQSALLVEAYVTADSVKMRLGVLGEQHFLAAWSDYFFDKKSADDTKLTEALAKQLRLLPSPCEIVTIDFWTADLVEQARQGFPGIQVFHAEEAYAHALVAQMAK